MPFLSRLRRPGTRNAGAVALTVALAVFLAACGQQNYPESIFHQRTDVESGCRLPVQDSDLRRNGGLHFRRRHSRLDVDQVPQTPWAAGAEHVHGNTTLEIAWTVIPLVILILIAIPTVRTIFKTQAVARSDALQVEVIGHQWWWEFRYPQYTRNGGSDTRHGNELYLPVGTDGELHDDVEGRHSLVLDSGARRASAT